MSLLASGDQMPGADAFDGRSAAGEPNRLYERRNFVVLALHQIVLRIGWVFKTESIIIPAFLDTIAEAGWLRGCLPILNRFGQSIPPVFVADQLARMPRKKWGLFTYTAPMALTCLALAAIWFLAAGVERAWMPLAFFALYAMFFAATGMSQLAFGTLQGKLVEPDHRGRLMSISNAIGAPSAILFAWWLLGDWLARPHGGFELIFGFAGACFVLASLSSLALKEFPDQQRVDTAPAPGALRTAWRTLRGDRNFQILAVVAMLFGTTLILFPHYQALARERLGLKHDHLMLWVVVQNAGMGVFSVLAGPLGDFRGYRVVLRVLILAGAATPLVAITLVQFDRELAGMLFSCVFLLIGLTPVTLKSLVNYTLETSRPEDHPRYLSTLNLCLAAPFCFSPLVGWLVDVAGFEAVFLGGDALIIAGGLLTYRLEEPRIANAEVPSQSP